MSYQTKVEEINAVLEKKKLPYFAQESKKARGGFTLFKQDRYGQTLGELTGYQIGKKDAIQDIKNRAELSLYELNLLGDKQGSNDWVERAKSGEQMLIM